MADRISETERRCKHDADFKFLALSAADRIPGVWVCKHYCGFAMNYNPVTYPHGIAFIHQPEGKVIRLVPSKTG